MPILDDAVAFIRSTIIAHIKDCTDPVNFALFLESGLKLQREEARYGAWCYIGAAACLDNEPGLGISNASSDKVADARKKSACDYTINADREIAWRIAERGIGIVQKGILNDWRELRLSAYLKQYKTPVSAAKALSPAKRDALRMEATKLMDPDIWYFRDSCRSSAGVRG